MGMMEAIELFFKNYTNFEGRSRRAEYWWIILANLIIGAVAGFIIGAIGGGFANLNVIGLLLTAVLGLYFLAILVPSIALGVRRFHDLDQTGWLVLVFALVGLIPLIGFLAVIAQYIWFAMPGTTGPNKYGPDPKSGHDVGVFN
ncbi:MAG: DUF805 domain-containing protein [Pseudomonadota bacterium]